MALPVTLSGLNASRRIVGPFKSSGGNYYLFGQNSTTATTLTCLKSSAPDTSWSSVATKTGYANDILGLAGYQVGDTIHMVVNDVQSAGATWNYKYLTFDMSTDTFPIAETITSAINSSDSALGVYGLCEIVFRPSDSQPVVLYPGPRVSGEAKVNYKRRTGVATWSAAVVVDAATATTDNYPMGIALGASSTIHFLYMELLNGVGPPTPFERALTSANALQTRVSLGANFNHGGAYKGNSLVNAGTTKVVFISTNSTTGNGIAGYFDSASVPTINTSGAIGASGAVDIGGCRIYTDGTDFWALYTRLDTHDVYYSKSTNSGATWSAETLAMTATATAGGPNGDEFLNYNGTTYARGSNQVLGYVVNDGGTLKYNEVVLRALSGNTYNDSVAETAAAADAPTSQATFAAAVAETAAAADAPTTSVVFARSVAEAAAATDAVTMAAVFPASVAESAAATDAVSSRAVFAAQVGESAAATDTQSTGNIFAFSVAETAAASDAVSSRAVFAASVAEAAAATDSPSASAAPAVYNVSIAETAAAADALTGDVVPGGIVPAPPIIPVTDVSSALAAYFPGIVAQANLVEAISYWIVVEGAVTQDDVAAILAIANAILATQNLPPSLPTTQDRYGPVPYPSGMVRIPNSNPTPSGWTIVDDGTVVRGSES